MTDWRTLATSLWGQDFTAPMSAVLDVNVRTVERWKAGKIVPPASVEAELRELISLMPSTPRAIGAVAWCWTQNEGLNFPEISEAAQKLSWWVQTNTHDRSLAIPPVS